MSSQRSKFFVLLSSLSVAATAVEDDPRSPVINLTVACVHSWWRSAADQLYRSTCCSHTHTHSASSPHNEAGLMGRSREEDSTNGKRASRLTCTRLGIKQNGNYSSHQKRGCAYMSNGNVVEGLNKRLYNHGGRVVTCMERESTHSQRNITISGRYRMQDIIADLQSYESSVLPMADLTTVNCNRTLCFFRLLVWASDCLELTVTVWTSVREKPREWTHKRE